MELPNLKIGLTGSAEITVQDTAPRIGSGRVSVLATPVMINLMEAAALNAVERLLPHGHQSLGTRLEVGHYAATPVGMRLRATAELNKIEGRNLEFRVETLTKRSASGTAGIPASSSTSRVSMSGCSKLTVDGLKK